MKVPPSVGFKTDETNTETLHGSKDDWAISNVSTCDLHMKAASICSSIFFHSSRAVSRGKQSKKRCPDFSLPGRFLHLLWGDPKAFQGQLRDWLYSSVSWTPPQGLNPVEHAQNATGQEDGQEASKPNARAIVTGSSRCGRAPTLLQDGSRVSVRLT